ncbi:MAG: superoxide dismutase [Opitutae bacterium]|nr:superoxide dismutase [Opitutae bacterium]
MNAQNSTNMTRRDALKTIGAGVMLAGMAAMTGKALGADTPAAGAPAAGALGWELPKLPYAYNALEPHIDARTMEIHHTKHHQAYITNAKKLLEAHPDLLARGPEALVRDLASVPESIRPGIRNNAGGHVNHAFFWKIIAPDTGASIGQLPVAIAGAFGSMDEFKKQFADAALKRFGSGWAWLVLKDGKLQVTSSANQDSPLTDGAHPLIGLDVWEHAYYLHYQNRRADYITAFWNVVNWTQAEENFGLASKV